jgi:hypothetical protein
LNDIKGIVFLSMILSLITPVLGSLTVAYADDTIILDYMIFVFVHFIYYDFEQKNPISPGVKAPEGLENNQSPAADKDKTVG